MNARWTDDDGMKLGVHVSIGGGRREVGRRRHGNRTTGCSIFGDGRSGGGRDAMLSHLLLLLSDGRLDLMRVDLQVLLS